MMHETMPATAPAFHLDTIGQIALTVRNLVNRPQSGDQCFHPAAWGRVESAPQGWSVS
jgi:hypothetical protein